MKQVRLIPDPYAPLWCLWWGDLYLCGYLDRAEAVKAAEREGWKVAK